MYAEAYSGEVVSLVSTWLIFVVVVTNNNILRYISMLNH